MKAVKTKIRAPKKADRISGAKDVIGDSFIALFHDDLRLCEENLYTLFELKSEKGSIVKLDMHSGEIYLFKGEAFEKIDYSRFPTIQKNGGKGAGKYKHLNEKNWKSLTDKNRLTEIFDYHNPQPVLRTYPTDVTPPDFEAYYIKLYEGEKEKCVYLRNVGEDNWRVFYAESFGAPLGFEAYSLSEYVLKEILTGTDRRSVKGQVDCFDRLVGIDEIQYLSAFMPNVHEMKRPKGLHLASDDEGKTIVNAYYWKKNKSVPCADEDYILPLFNSLKEIAVNSVELEFEDEEKESDDIDDILDEIAKGGEAASVEESAPEQQQSEEASEPEPEEAGKETDYIKENEQQIIPAAEQEQTGERENEPEGALSEETKPESEKNSEEGKAPKHKRKLSLFGRRKKSAEGKEEKEAEAVFRQNAEEQPREESEETSDEETVQPADNITPEESEQIIEQSEKAKPFEAEIISLPLEEGEAETQTEPESGIDNEAETILGREQTREASQGEAEEKSSVTLESIPKSFSSLADELLGTKPKIEEEPAQEEEAEELSDETQEEFKLEFEPEKNEAVPDEVEPDGAEETEEAESEVEESEEVESAAEETPEAEEQSDEPARIETAKSGLKSKAEKKAKSEKVKKSEKARENKAFFELSALIGAYSVAGRKKSKIKSEILKALPYSPLIVPITAAEYSDCELVYVSKQCYKLCGEKIVPFTMIADKKALLPVEENESLRKGVMVQTVVNMGKAYIPVFSDFKSAAQIFGANEKFGLFTLKNLLTHISSSETIQGITLNPGTVNLKLVEKDFESK